MVIPLEGNDRYQSTYQRVVCWWSTFHVPSLEVTKTLFLLQFQFTIFIFLKLILYPSHRFLFLCCGSKIQ